ncbi:MAG: ImmA/IrrE family metallo-endopeptidase [Flavobacteriales bacterium]|nr:ImmA/IrrE family metallo-endopeptidase [Flavobacteriales bacterium]
MPSTTERGDAFEDTCYNVILDALKNNKLSVLPEHAIVYRKKSYWSKLREDNIVFDLSIELTPPGAERPVSIWLIECKDYSGSVPVNDVEEFRQKVMQVADLNCKAVIMTTGQLQAGARTTARNSGMMFIQVTPEITYDIVFHKASRFGNHRRGELKQAQTEYQRLVELEEKTLTIILRAVSEHIQRTIQPESLKPVPFLADEDIELVTQNILNAIDDGILSVGMSLTFSRFIDFMKKAYGVDVVFERIGKHDADGRIILSSCSFRERLIRIDTSLPPVRQHFAIAHEAGHYLLHNKTLLGQSEYEMMEDSTYSYSAGKNELNNDRQWLEWQANRFATHLLMPKFSMVRHFAKAQGGAPHKLVVDAQRVNKKEYFRIVDVLSSYFKVSKQSIGYRLEELGLAHVQVPLGTSSIREVMQRMFANDPD